MFSMMFEDKKLQSDFEKYFKIQYVNLAWDFKT